MLETPRHKVFTSFHHEDQYYKDEFVKMMGDYIVDKSVEDGDIDDSLPTNTIRQKIRDEIYSRCNRYCCANWRMHLAAEACRLGDRIKFEEHKAKFKVRSLRDFSAYSSQL